MELFLLFVLWGSVESALNGEDELGKLFEVKGSSATDPVGDQGESFIGNFSKGESEMMENVVAVALTAPMDCHPVYSFDTVGPYRQEEAKSRAKERIYYYRETDMNEEDNSILTKDEFGLVCFTKMINCTVPPTATTTKKTPNCVYFEKEFCTRKYGGMKWKGSICPPTPLASQTQEFKCGLRPLGGVGSIEVISTGGSARNKTLVCKNSHSLCLSLKPPFHTRSGSSDRNPPTQIICLCPLGYTGLDCGRMDLDLYHLDLLHNIDLRNILLKYQQKDRYFIGVTLLFLLVVTLSSVLLVVAGCSFLFFRLVPRALGMNDEKNGAQEGAKGSQQKQTRKRWWEWGCKFPKCSIIFTDGGESSVDREIPIQNPSVHLEREREMKLQRTRSHTHDQHRTSRRLHKGRTTV